MIEPAARDVYLAAGEIYFGEGRVRVHTVLGTCIAIALWHPLRRIGGICHFLLPSRRTKPGAGDPLSCMYADEVMDSFAASLRATQSLSRDYVVKLTGGGNMFPDHLMYAECRQSGCSDARRAVCPGVGCMNILSARSLLAAGGFAIAAENVGGRGSRQVIFELWSGEVFVKRGAAMANSAKSAP